MIRFLLLLLPILEIASIIMVGSRLGVLATLGLILLSGMVGAILLRFQGFGAVRRIQAEIDAGRNPGRQMAHGAMIMVAGILLLIPGFVTDIIGLLLFIPFIRDLAWRFLRTRLSVVTSFSTGFAGGRRYGARDKTIDLEEQEFSRERPGDRPHGQSRGPSPWRQIDNDN